MKKTFYLKRAYYLLIVLALGLLGAFSVYGADSNNNQNNDQIDSPIKSVNDIIGVLQRIVGYMYTIFFIAAVGAILWAAFTYLRAGQDAKLVEQAKNQLKFAVVAIVVALVAGGVSLIIKSFLQSAGS
ncbi:MAG: hypothetical protein KatS3mg098_106 [Candidatus Parcubacteria bacterium]|nr:MAG: hypothetical protein KatS3mg098_106 [Candidatus Parcubacteria bacterium]